MKIGIVLPSVPGYSETFFTSKIKGLQSHGFKVVLFVNNYAKNASLNCEIIIAPKFSKNKGKNTFVSLFYFLKAVLFHFKHTQNLYQLDKKEGLSFSKRMKSIVLNSHLLTQKLDWLHFGFGTMAIDRENVAAAIGAKMAVSFRGFDHYVYPLKNKECYEALFSKKVKYHVLSDGMKNDLIKQSISKDKIVTITPAINTKLFSSQSAFENKNNFITVARLHWIKGLDYTLEALSILHQKGIDFNYTIIGDGKEKERLQFLVHQLNLQDKVFFLGKLEHQEIQNQLDKATYYIQYSIQEGFCNAVLEAQAMGLICIVSDAEGLKENVLDNVTGFVVPKRNPLSLANRIIAVNELSAKERDMISELAVKRVKKEFNIEDQVTKFIKFYEED